MRMQKKEQVKESSPVTLDVVCISSGGIGDELLVQTKKSCGLAIGDPLWVVGMPIRWFQFFGSCVIRV